MSVEHDPRTKQREVQRNTLQHRTADQSAHIDWHSLADSTITPDIPHNTAELLLNVDPQVMNQGQRLAAIHVAERTIAALSAIQADMIGAVADCERATLAAQDALHPPLPGASVPDPERELVALALRVSPQSAADRVHHALVIRDRLPLLMHHMRAGRLFPAVARAIADETSLLDVADARTVTEQALPLAHESTPTRVRRRCRQLALRINPADAARHHERALALRRVGVQSDSDGMASLWWHADAATIGRVWHLIDSQARTQHHREVRDRHGIHAARSDAVAQLLLNNAPFDSSTTTGATPRSVIAVHVALSTLIGADDMPAEVPQLGHIPAEAARALAAESDWLAHVHHTSGQLTHVATRGYTPTPAMVALIRARDRTCAFPQCQQPSHRCDLDHITPFDHDQPERGGATHPDNLQPLCRRHHNLKTSGQWSAMRETNGAPDGNATTIWLGPHHTQARSHPLVEHDPYPPW